MNKEEKVTQKMKFYYYISIILLAIFLVVVLLIKYPDVSSEPEVVQEVTLSTMSQEEIEEIEFVVDQTEIEMLARLVWGEARGCTTTEQAAVMWCVLNRVDSEDPLFPDTIQEVITQKNQFHGYNINNPIWPELEDLARDVLMRWLTNEEGRVLPPEYCWFSGDGSHNYFRDAYGLKKANIWDWSLESPYEN